MMISNSKLSIKMPFSSELFSGGDRVFQVRLGERIEPGVRRPLPQQLHGQLLRAAVHGRQEEQERTLPGLILHQDDRILQ